MRIIFIIMMIACNVALSAQYISGLAPDSVDVQVSVIEDMYRVTDLENPKLASDKLLSYWEDKKKSNPSKPVFQNYYYALTRQLILSNALDLITKDSVDLIMSIEQDIKRDLPKNNIALAKFYYLISEIQGKVIKDASSRIDYLEKSLELYQIESPNFPRGRFIVLNALGNAHRIAREYKKAQVYLEQSLNDNTQLVYPDTATLISTFYDLGATAYYQRKYESGTAIALEGFDLAVGYLEEGHSKIPLLGRIVGLMYNATGEFDKSLEFAEKMLATQKGENGERKKGIARYYASVSGLYQRLGDIKLSISYADSAIMYAERDTERTLLPGYIHNKALITEDSEEAIALYKRAYELCEADEDCPIANRSIMLQNLGNEYYTAGNVSKALNFVTQAKVLKENNYSRLGVYLPSTYGSLALINSTLGDTDLAIEYQTKSLKTVREFRPAKSFFEGTELARLGRFYIDADRLDEADNVLNEALSILESTAGIKNEQTLLTYRYLSKLYNKKGQNKKAILFGKKSLNAARSYGMSATTQLKAIADYYTEEGNIDSAKAYMNLLFIESGVTFDKSDEKKDDRVTDNKWTSFTAYMNYLKVEERIYGNEQSLIIEKIEKGVQLIDNLRSDFFFKSSEREFQKVTREFFNWSLGKLSSQYASHPSTETLGLIFQCMERSKSISINRNFVRRNSLWEGDVPTTVLDNEKRILEDYNINYDKYKRAIEGDSLKDQYSDKMYQLEIERIEFLELLKSDYPVYYQNRYNQSVTTLEEITMMTSGKDLGIMIFHWGDSLIHRFIITPEQKNFLTIKTKDIEPDLIKIEQILSDQQVDANEADFGTVKSTFIKSARSVYLSLFDSVDSAHVPFDLFIIPDGRFVKLPFEILVTKPFSDGDSYRSLSYLLRDHAISYAGTATELTISKITDDNRNKELYGGFAPQYMLDTTLLLQDSQTIKRSTVSPLLYNQEEVQRSAELFNGDMFLGAEASEALFQEKSKSYRILHLAMHTSLNDQYPMESYLNFSYNTSSSYDELHDGQLHVNEIAKLNLNSDLVVLSACETNNGDDFLGEGVLGIARAFQLASCSNMVLSNWLVDDRSSSKIIFSFFSNLFNSAPPSHALRTAKLDFLDQSAVTYSHPKYWAAFSYYGNMEELDFKAPSDFDTNFKLLFFFSSLILLIAGRFIFFK